MDKVAMDIRNNNPVNFFIVGAAKSGTTSLAHYLDQHPDVYMCPVKEPHYFATDIRPEELRPMLKRRLKSLKLDPIFDSQGKKKLHRAFISDSATYHKLFSFARPDQIMGEASPSYLFSETAAAEIYRYNPKAKIIVLMREPISRAWSHYQMDLRLGYHKGTFEEALLADEKMPGKSWGSKSHFYALGLYFRQVERYLKIFPRNQILFLLYDELCRNPDHLMQKVYEFLELSKPTVPIDYSVRNEANIPRIFLHPSLEPLVEKLKNFIGPGFLKSHLKKIFYTQPSASSSRPETIQRLHEFFRKDIEQLENTTGLNLSSWKKAH